MKITSKIFRTYSDNIENYKENLDPWDSEFHEIYLDEWIKFVEKNLYEMKKKLDKYEEVFEKLKE